MHNPNINQKVWEWENHIVQTIIFLVFKPKSWSTNPQFAYNRNANCDK